jgi:hypothetical protein
MASGVALMLANHNQELAELFDLIVNSPPALGPNGHASRMRPTCKITPYRKPVCQVFIHYDYRADAGFFILSLFIASGLKESRPRF